MKTTISLLVLRYKNKPIKVVPIEDKHTVTQLSVDVSILDADTVNVLNGIKSIELSRYNSTYYLGEGDAKDFRDFDDKLTVKIEEIEIEVQ